MAGNPPPFFTSSYPYHISRTARRVQWTFRYSAWAFQRQRQRAFLAFAAEGCRYWSLSQRRVVQMWAHQRCAAVDFAPMGLGQFHGEILFYAGQYSSRSSSHHGKCSDSQPRLRGQSRQQLAATENDSVPTGPVIGGETGHRRFIQRGR